MFLAEKAEYPQVPVSRAIHPREQGARTRRSPRRLPCPVRSCIIMIQLLLHGLRMGLSSHPLQSPDWSISAGLVAYSRHLFAKFSCQKHTFTSIPFLKNIITGLFRMQESGYLCGEKTYRNVSHVTAAFQRHDLIMSLDIPFRSPTSRVCPVQWADCREY
jgi:hypothetical protein